MRLLGLACGRRMGNSEILLREALMGAEEVREDVDVEILRVVDLDIRPCKGCKVCLRFQGGLEACAQKDDSLFFYNKFMDCDGLIIASPVWTLTPPGYLIHARDRALGPFVDVAGHMMRRQMQGSDEGMDKRVFKNRPGGYISVGGAPLLNWVTLGLPLIHTVTFSPNIAVVDQMQVLKANEQIGSVLLNDQAVERARRLGRNVVQAMGKPLEEMKYVGYEPGTCPVCHLDLMVMRGDSTVECAVCGIKGDIKVDGGKVTVVFSEEEQEKSRLTIEGKRIHMREIFETREELMPRYDEIPAKLRKYKSYKSPIKPPSRIRKKARA
jgi:multimeric flavodoxin WrbA